MEYYVEDVINTLKNVKNNPYGIKDSDHAFDRARKRGVDLNDVDKYLCNGLLVGVEKSFNESSIFQLLYEHKKFEDLCIVINILNEEETRLITLIEKDVNKRNHYAY